MIIGHESTVKVLERSLPQVTLIQGPVSVGKRTLARHLVQHWNIKAYDLFTTPGVLSIDQVRALRSFVIKAPFGKWRLVVLHLDDSSGQAQNALLKILEEPPRTVKFLLTASTAPLATVMSRCEKYQLGYLSTVEVSKVLISQGMTPAQAGRAAKNAGGQVKNALLLDSNATAQKANVVEMMQSIASGNRDGFHRALNTWDTEASMLLTVWFTEAISQRWLTFERGEGFGLEQDRDKLMNMITALARVVDARPRLQTRAALEQFVGR